MNVAIIGCGLIGRKRAGALGGCNLLACADVDRARAEAFAEAFPGTVVAPDWKAAATHPEADIVVVATTHDALAPITQAAVEAGKHVLVEKPAARRPEELDPVIAAAARSGVKVRVGFNHRYHPSFIKAREILDSGELGELLYIRGRYGHGGRVGYDKEWRADREIAGGGELIDQGMHLIDLSRTFLGDFVKVQGATPTCFWDMEVEDNGFMLLETAAGQVAFLHTTWTEWKNMFSFEVTGRDGKLDFFGLGGSYGTERLAFYKMLPEMGPPRTTIWEYPGRDTSWEVEFDEFLQDIADNRKPWAGLEDARAALTLVHQLYGVTGR